MDRLICSLSLAALLPIAAQAGPTEIDYPGATRAYAYACDAQDNVVAGTYYDSQGISHGYIYDTRGRTYTPFDVPNSVTTTVYDDVGGKLVGSYTDPTGRVTAYAYDTTSRMVTNLDPPGAATATTYSYDPGHNSMPEATPTARARRTAIPTMRPTAFTLPTTRRPR